MDDITNTPGEGVQATVTTQEERTVSFTPDAVAQVSQSHGILGTAKAKTGSTIVNRPVQGDDIVVVRGIELSVDQALNSGFLTKNEKGDIVDVSPADAEAAEQRHEKIDQEKREAEARAQADEWGVGLEQTTHDMLDAQLGEMEAVGMNPATIINDLANGQAMPQSLEVLARETGRDPMQMQVQLGKIVQEVTTAVEDLMIIKKHFDPAQLPKFWAWANVHAQHELRSAAMAAVMRRDGRGYLALAERFQTAFGHGQGPSGLKVEIVKIAGQNVEYVNVPGRGKMRLDAARRMGLV